ncbi:MAG: hypothetical protein HYY00_06335 [Chloroflexi bacterium]|nr:hypothetical protein [Chloroflexota bacterium]
MDEVVAVPDVEQKYERKYGLDKALAGKRAECDGGASYPAVMPNGEMGYMPSRETFKGRLTGLYFDQGDPPWRWYELMVLEDRPPNYPDETVWCEQGFLFIFDDETGEEQR